MSPNSETVEVILEMRVTATVSPDDVSAVVQNLRDIGRQVHAQCIIGHDWGQDVKHPAKLDTKMSVSAPLTDWVMFSNASKDQE